jgi:hypothetical protein
MGNRIWNRKTGDSLKMQNGATYVFISVLLLAGSDLAETLWEKEFVTWLGGRDQSIFGLGNVGFDIDDIAWSPGRFDEQKEFIMAMIDTALRRHRWEMLDYDPPYVHIDLAALRTLIEKYTIEMAESAQPWKRWLGEPESLSKCPKHDVYEHAHGCLLCHDQVYPSSLQDKK